MRTGLPFILVGGVLGWGIAWVIGTPSGRDQTPRIAPPAVSLACDTNELTQARERVARLESELRRNQKTQGEEPPKDTAGREVLSDPSAQLPESPDQETQDAAEAIRWRISAIEKFVPLSEAQRERLREKYDREGAATESGEDASTESLEQILGEEGAAYYRGQVQAAFKRVRDEEVDREVVWLSRKLALSAEQERGLQGVLARVEEQLSGERSHSEASRSPGERVKAMIADNRQRNELRNQELRGILTPDQYQAYLRMEAESAASDVEIFHEAPSASTTPGN